MGNDNSSEKKHEKKNKKKEKKKISKRIIMLCQIIKKDIEIIMTLL